MSHSVYKLPYMNRLFFWIEATHLIVGKYFNIMLKEADSGPYQTFKMEVSPERSYSFKL